MTESTTPASTPNDSPEAVRKAGLRKAYGLATSALRDAHRSEFQSLYHKAAKELGIDWSPRPTAEDKAREEMATLLREHPGLVDEFAKQLLHASEAEVAETEPPKAE